MQLVRISGRRPWRLPTGSRTNITLPDEDDPAPCARRRLAIRALVFESAAMLGGYLALVMARITWWRPASFNWYGIVESLLIGMGPGLLSIWLSRRMIRRMNAPPASLADMCAACTHSLTGVSTDSDGCVVCPECGAAWRVSALDVQSSNAED